MMILIFTNKVIIRYLWGAMALYLLNISVDTPDFHSNTITEDLSINDQESLVEVILEEILGFEDLIPEYDDPDSEEPESQKKGNSFKIETLPLKGMPNFQAYSIENHKLTFSEFQQPLAEGFDLLDTPPPKI